HIAASGPLNASAVVAAERPTTATGSAQSAITRNFAPGSTRTGRPMRWPISRTDLRRDCVVTCASARLQRNQRAGRGGPSCRGLSGRTAVIVAAVLMDRPNRLSASPNSSRGRGKRGGRPQIVVERVALFAVERRLGAQTREVATDGDRPPVVEVEREVLHRGDAVGVDLIRVGGRAHGRAVLAAH